MNPEIEAHLKHIRKLPGQSKYKSSFTGTTYKVEFGDIYAETENSWIFCGKKHLAETTKESIANVELSSLYA
jgi:hypothetical protein